jgi:hypothetical protein
MFSNREEFLKSIKEVNLDEVKEKKVSFESILSMSKTMNEYNPMAHSMYLQLNKGCLSADEIYFHQEVINKLLNNEKKLVNEALKIMEDVTQTPNLNNEVKVVQKPIVNKDKEIEV